MTANEMKDYFNLKTDGAVFKERTFNDREVSAFLTLAEREFVKSRFDALKNRTGRGFETASSLIQSDVRLAELAAVLSASTTFKRSLHDFMRGTESNGAYRTPDLDAAPDDVQAWGVFCRIPDEALYIVSESAEITKGVHRAPNIPVRPINPMLYNDLIYDSFKNPSFDTVWGLDHGSYTTSYNLDVNADGTPNAALETSTKYGDTRVDALATSTTLTGFKGHSAYDGTTPVQITTQRSKQLVAGKGWDVDKYVIHYIKTPRNIVVNTRVPALQQNSELASAFHEEIIDIAVKLATAAVIPAEAKYQVADKEQAQDQ